MNHETKYQYQKRIKELEDENRKLEVKLYDYRTSVLEIFDGCLDVKEEAISKNWVLKRLKRCFK